MGSGCVLEGADDDEKADRRRASRLTTVARRVVEPLRVIDDDDRQCRTGGRVADDGVQTAKEGGGFGLGPRRPRPTWRRTESRSGRRNPVIRTILRLDSAAANSSSNRDFRHRRRRSRGSPADCERSALISVFSSLSRRSVPPIPHAEKDSQRGVCRSVFHRPGFSTGVGAQGFSRVAWSDGRPRLGAWMSYWFWSGQISSTTSAGVQWRPAIAGSWAPARETSWRGSALPAVVVDVGDGGRTLSDPRSSAGTRCSWYAGPTSRQTCGGEAFELRVRDVIALPHDEVGARRGLDRPGEHRSATAGGSRGSRWSWWRRATTLAAAVGLAATRLESRAVACSSSGPGRGSVLGSI